MPSHGGDDGNVHMQAEAMSRTADWNAGKSLNEAAFPKKISTKLANEFAAIGV
jgi:hypothetical protein